MNRLNVNTIISFTNDIKLKDFIKNLEKNENLKNFRSTEDNIHVNRRKIKLGEGKHECLFDLYLDNEYINVRFYIMFDLETGTIFDIDAFTGESELFDINRYEQLVRTILTETIEYDAHDSGNASFFNMQMEFVGNTDATISIKSK